MKIYILYSEGNNYIRQLCISEIDPTQADILIPHIGETFIDKVTDIEYEVKDVIRSIDAMNEFGVQVLLKRREKRKYK